MRYLSVVIAALLFSLSPVQAQEDRPGPFSLNQNRQVFKADGTWIKPPGGRWVHRKLIGVGASGQSGAAVAPDATGWTAPGGHGGGGATIYEDFIDADCLAATEPVVVPSPPSGGGGIASPISEDEEENGNVGLSGGNVVFSTGSTQVQAAGGRYPASNQNSLILGVVVSAGAGNSSNPLLPCAGGDGGTVLVGAPSTFTAGSNGGNQNNTAPSGYTATLVGGLGGGFFPHVDGEAGATGSRRGPGFIGGTGAGGGAGSVLTDGGVGGLGTLYGAGGGGGGAAIYPHQSGPGGPGGPGVVVITTTF